MGVVGVLHGTTGDNIREDIEACDGVDGAQTGSILVSWTWTGIRSPEGLARTILTKSSHDGCPTFSSRRPYQRTAALVRWHDAKPILSALGVQ
jgi:hypothetical protein